MASASSFRKGQCPVYKHLGFSDVQCEDHDGQPCCMYCKTCKKLICMKCIPAIHNRHDFSDEEGNFSFSDIKCKDHQDQLCCMYCKTCKQIICLKCIPRSHNGHEFVDEETFKGKINTETGTKENINQSLDKNADVGLAEQHELKTIREWETDLRSISSMNACSDGSLWICDGGKRMLQCVRLRDGDVEIISKYDMTVYDMALTPYGDIVLSIEDTSLRIISEKQSKINIIKYNISPLHTRGIHVTKDFNVIICALSQGNPFLRSGRRVVILMDQEGNKIKEYEYDETNTPLFTYPTRVTSISNGNICVIDRLDETRKGRVVIVSELGEVITFYTGNQTIKKKKPFSPRGIVITPSDNIVITDSENHSLHILNSNGQFIAYYNTSAMGIKNPHSLAVSGLVKLYIGLVCKKRSSDTFKIKICEMEYCGF